MNAILTLCLRELRAYLDSRSALILLAAFSLVFGWFFWALFTFFAQLSMQVAGGPASEQLPVHVNQELIRPLFQNASLLVLFVLPLVTMRIYAEESRSGTMELLLTAPLTNTQIVVGKYLGALSFYCLMLAATLLNVAVLFFFGRPEIAPILAGYLGLLLLGSCLISVGLMVSSATGSQMIAGAATFLLFLILWAAGWVPDLGGAVTQTILSHVSILEQFDDFGKGTIETRHVLSQLSITFYGLYLTRLSLEMGRRFR